MSFDPEFHDRRSIRLPDFDYGQPGIYYVTLCAKNRACLFGDVISGEMRLSEIGRIVEDEWLKTPALRPQATLDRHVVMPNHLHGVIIIRERRGELPFAPMLPASRAPKPRSFRSPSQTLGAIVRGFKGSSAKRINAARNTPGGAVWQRNYYEHIVRSESELNRIRDYIRNNPP